MSRSAFSPIVPPPFQAGFVVDDMDAALRYWTNTIGAGPFFVFPSNQWKELYYNGAPTHVDIMMALGQWGDTQIELIKQVNDTPSAYTPFLKAGRRGIHHFCSMVDDLDDVVAKLEARGKRRAYWGTAISDVRFVYMAEDEQSGAMIELIEHCPAIDGLMEMVRSAARDWDGTDPIRHLT